jgi:antitoxin component of RelBE/YafQ-DinJ toxin-antitoxin module
MEIKKSNGIIDAVDFRLQTILRDADSQAQKHIPGTTQVTVRIDNDLKAELDVVARFLGSTRNALINEFLTIAVEEARLRIGDNPYISDMTVNGKTIGQATAAALKGETDPSADLVHDLVIGKITVEQVMDGQK